VVIPVLNQLCFTVGWLESLNRAGVPDSQIVMLNNGETNGTAEFLVERPGIKPGYGKIKNIQIEKIYG